MRKIQTWMPNMGEVSNLMTKDQQYQMLAEKPTNEGIMKY